jgi:16S rRNA (uracil1498-N3)-methyltransferase
MQIFYAPGISGDTWILDEKESKHCIRVLRMRKESPVRLIDGKGNLYEGRIAVTDPVRCIIAIDKVIPGFEERRYYLHIAISPLKNPERFEWFIEKSVEIGIDEITPLLCRNSEKHSIKAERINNIIISAMKQSLKAWLTVLNDPVTFEDFIQQEHRGKRMIAHCSDANEKSSVAEIYTKGSDAVILIGPEGDFSDEEIKLAVEGGFQPVHMGRSRLRTETAGVAACHSIYLLNQ